MSGSLPGRSTFRPPAGLVGMLALVAAVEAGIVGIRTDLVSPAAEDWRVAAQAASAKAPGCDVLCFGDSLVKYGVLPRVIEARTGLRAHNLATSGGTMALTFFLFRQALDAGARPGAVVVDFAALMTRDPYPPSLLNYPELATVGDCLDLAWTARDAGFFASSALSKALASYRWRFEVRRAVRIALDGGTSSHRSTVEAHRRLWEREAGANSIRGDRAYHPREDFLIDGVSPSNWACEPVDRAYLDRFLALAGSRRVVVYWLLPPLAPEVHGRRGARGTDATYAGFVRTVAGRHPGVVVVDARGSGYDNTVHLDHLHLNRRGATVLSVDLAKVLAGQPSGPAWVDLPPFAGRTGDEPPTGLARSRPPTTR